MPKKQWNKPELIVLVRGRPEEAILAGCKSTSTGGPVSDIATCRMWTELAPSPCAIGCSSADVS